MARCCAVDGKHWNNIFSRQQFLVERQKMCLLKICVWQTMRYNNIVSRELKRTPSLPKKGTVIHSKELDGPSSTAGWTAHCFVGLDDKFRVCFSCPFRDFSPKLLYLILVMERDKFTSSGFFISISWWSWWYRDDNTSTLAGHLLFVVSFSWNLCLLG